MTYGANSTVALKCNMGACQPPTYTRVLYKSPPNDLQLLSAQSDTWPLICVNHTSIYSVFSKCLCNLNARFTHIFLKITLIPHLFMFCRIKRKIKQGKRKKLRRTKRTVRSTGLSRQGGSPRRREGFGATKEKQEKEEASGLPRQRVLGKDTLCRGEEVRLGEESFTEANEVLIRRHSRVCLGEAYLRQGKACLH